ncbi:MAG: hypothetical protein AAGI07_02010, partial [Bacteroidota bacterium]
FTSNTLFAQEKTRFYLKPHLGMEWAFSRFEDKATIPTFIERTGLSPSVRYGLGFLIDFGNKWGIEVGYTGAELGWGVHYNSKTDSVENAISGRYNNFTTIHRFHLSFFKSNALIVIRKKRGAYLRKHAKEKKEYDYFASFNLGVLGGAAYEYIPLFGVASFLSDGFNPSHSQRTTDVLSLSSIPSEKSTRHGGSIYFGLYSQFLQAGKKRLQLGIIYQQGIPKRLISNWETSINGVTQPDFQTFTRGSYLALYATYPIQLFTISGKNSKRFKG